MANEKNEPTFDEMIRDRAKQVTVYDTDGTAFETNELQAKQMVESASFTRTDPKVRREANEPRKTDG